MKRSPQPSSSPGQTPAHAKSRTLLLAGLLLGALAAAYAVSLRGAFLWDDDLHITANPTIVGPLGLKEIWTSSHANYFPLVLTNFWLQHAAWGVEPLGYRVVTLLFHGLSALLLWRVLGQLRVPGAWLGAALWALHPVQVESVAWICELKNTQSAAFFLLAVSCWLHGFDSGPATRTRRWYFLALVCAVLAILSKPSTVMLPVALGLATWWMRGRLEWRDAVRLAPFFALSALAAGWTIWEQKFHSGAIGPEWSQTLPERVAIAGRVLWFYLGKLAWPEPLIFIYPRWSIDATQPLAYLATLAAAAAGLLLLWRGRSGAGRPVLFAAAFFVALLFPVLGFFSVYFFRYSFVGDHFQYLASMGPLALAGAAIAGWGGRWSRVLGAGLVVVLGLASARQARVYLNNEALWRDTLAHNPQAVMAWLNLGDTLAKSGRYEEAIVRFRQALAIREADPYGWNDLGNALVLVGRAPEALPCFERALTLKPDFPDALNNHGHALAALGRSTEAIGQYRRALAVNPDHVGVLNNLGVELAQTGNNEEAVTLLARASRLKPADGATWDNLASAMRQAGHMAGALASHREAVRLRPNSVPTQLSFARTLAALNRWTEAIPVLEQVVRLEPASPAYHAQLAVARVNAGDPSGAVPAFEAALRLDPGRIELHENFAQVLNVLGRKREAFEHLEEAARLRRERGR